jgi:ParB family chromosome partitioning protein
MAAMGWTPTVDNFLGRVTKVRILQAVAEAKGQRAADRIEHLKKGDMATEAETLLAGTGWLPEPLRTPKESQAEAEQTPAEDLVGEEAAESGEDSAMGEEDDLTDTDAASSSVAAE